MCLHEAVSSNRRWSYYKDSIDKGTAFISSSWLSYAASIDREDWQSIGVTVCSLHNHHAALNLHDINMASGITPQMLIVEVDASIPPNVGSGFYGIVVLNNTSGFVSTNRAAGWKE
nr:hypothetical protein Iba_chr10eCG10900 [Ipomoea batatas]